MANILRYIITLVLAKLGWLGKGLLAPHGVKPDPNDPQYRPVVHKHSLFEVDIRRLAVKESFGGGNQWFTLIAFDQDGERLGGVKLRWELERAGVGTVMDMPNWRGETRETDGACRFFHVQRPARYRLYIEDELIVSNIRTDLPWKCYSNGFCTHADIGGFVNPGLGGWLAVLRPGQFGYWITVNLRKGQTEEG